MVKTYIPQSLNEALEIMAKDECTVFAGGTDLMVKRKRWSGLEPEFESPVIFIGGLNELGEIKEEPGFLNIGAACTLAKIAEEPISPESLRCAILQMASPAIRNAATFGGNICNSSPAGDTLPLLYALEAMLVLESTSGSREVPISSFITGPGKNILRRDEILRAVRIPVEKFDLWSYRKVGTRKSTALAKLSFIGLVRKGDKGLKDIRLAFGAVGPTVIRDKEIEKEIVRMDMKNGRFDVEKIKQMYDSIIKPINDQRSTAFYRRKVCLGLLEDFVASIAAKSWITLDKN